MTPPIRLATAEDWPRIRALLVARDLPTEGAEAHLGEFLVATNGEAAPLVGVAGLERYGGVALLRSVAVAADAATRGLGTALVRALLERAEASAVQELYLLTTTAAGWFPRFGFREVTRASLPEELSSSAELRGACPQSAVPMRLALSRRTE